MTTRSILLLTGLAFSTMASAGLFDGIKKGLDAVNETLDDVNRQVDDIGQEVDDINRQVDDLNAEFDAIGNEFSDIKTRTRDIGRTRRSAGLATPASAATLDASQLALDDYSFDIKRIKLGETLQSLKEKYPEAKMMGTSPASLLPDPANENLRVKMAGDTDGTQYIAAIYLRQDLGASNRSSCESRVQSLEAKLLEKYGTDIKKTVKTDAGGTSYFITWLKPVPGSSGHSRLYSRATCSNDAPGNLDFTLVAKGEYVEEAVAARRSRDSARPQEMEADF